MVYVDRNEGVDDGGDLDRVSDLPSLPGSRKTSKDMMRKLSGTSYHTNTFSSSPYNNIGTIHRLFIISLFTLLCVSYVV
jgi:hypothetical protein